MPVFRTEQEKAAFKDILRDLYSRNEAAPSDWYKFSGEHE